MFSICRFIVLSGLFYLLSAAGCAGARAAPPSPPLFIPTSAWLVGPATLSADAAAAGMPCIMVNQFDNGYSFRIAADDQRVYALAVDFRQQAFTSGQTYSVTLAIPPGFEQELPGTAYNEATLLINTQEAGDFYKALAEGTFLKMGVGGKTLEFALLGVTEGLERLAGCYGKGGKDDLPAAGEAGAAREHVSLGMKSGTGKNLRQDAPAQESGGETAGQTASEMAAQAARDILPGNDEAGEPTAQPGPPGWQAPQEAPAKPRQAGKDILVNYQQAKPSGETPGAEGSVRQWRAHRGANLREVLDVWAGSEKARLIWMAGEDFPVAQSLSVQGTFESAVLSLLEQYREKTRPVGKIYIDRENPMEEEQKVLLIEREGP